MLGHSNAEFVALLGHLPCGSGDPFDLGCHCGAQPLPHPLRRGVRHRVTPLLAEECEGVLDNRRRAVAGVLHAVPEFVRYGD